MQVCFLMMTIYQRNSDNTGSIDSIAVQGFSLMTIDYQKNFYIK